MNKYVWVSGDACW